LVADHQRVAGGLHFGFDLGVIDDVIEPAHNWRQLVAALSAALAAPADTATSRCDL
jgi:hypothetical protein